jgi:CRP-like cAMP-binding protein
MEPSILTGLRSLQTLPKHELVDLLHYGESRALEQNEVLIETGSRVQAAYLLAQGGLVAELPSDSGSRLVGKIWPGEVTGEGALSHGYWISSVQVRAVVPSKVLLLTPEFFAKTRGTRAHAALQGHLIGVLAKRIQGTNFQLRKAWLEQEAAETQPRQATSAKIEPLTLGERLGQLFGVTP